MRCKKIQKLILTDYTDGEMAGSSRQEVKDHIGRCADCRALEKRLKEQIITPFQRTGHVQPPEEVWSRIKGVLEEPVRDSIRESITDFLRDLFIVRKPALVAVPLIVLMLVGGVFTKMYFTERSIVNTYLGEQLDFMDSLYDGNGYTDEYDGFLSEDLFF